MSQYVAMAPGVQVNGETVLAVGEGMSSFKLMAFQILKKHGINDPKAGQWYPHQALLDAIKEIFDRTGAATVKSIGKKVPDTALWPPNVNTIDLAMANLDAMYHRNYTKGEIGHYNFTKTGPKSGIVICDNPYPCDFDAGLLEAALKKYAPAGMVPVVKHDNSKPCRRKGGSTCTYVVSW
jgi:hypothetical protein